MPSTLSQARSLRGSASHEPGQVPKPLRHQHTAGPWETGGAPPALNRRPKVPIPTQHSAHRKPQLLNPTEQGDKPGSWSQSSQSPMGSSEGGCLGEGGSLQGTSRCSLLRSQGCSPTPPSRRRTHGQSPASRRRGLGSDPHQQARRDTKPLGDTSCVMSAPRNKVSPSRLQSSTNRAGGLREQG